MVRLITIVICTVAGYYNFIRGVESWALGIRFLGSVSLAISLCLLILAWRSTTDLIIYTTLRGKVLDDKDLTSIDERLSEIEESLSVIKQEIPQIHKRYERYLISEDVYRKAMESGCELIGDLQEEWKKLKAIRSRGIRFGPPRLL